MNKAFIFVLVAFAAVASAQNPPVAHRAQRQCRVDKEAYVSLAKGYERILRGQYTTKGEKFKISIHFSSLFGQSFQSMRNALRVLESLAL